MFKFEGIILAALCIGFTALPGQALAHHGHNGPDSVNSARQYRHHYEQRVDCPVILEDGTTCPQPGAHMHRPMAQHHMDRMNPMDRMEGKQAARPAWAQGARQIMATNGVVEAIEGMQITLRCEDGSLLVGNMNQRTNIVKGSNGKEIALSKLGKGDKVTMYHTAMMTRSLPAQTKAFAIVEGKASDRMGKYFRLGTIEPQGEELLLHNTSGDLVVALPAKLLQGQKLHPGTELLLWYDKMTMSLPAQAYATKAVVI